MHISRVMPALVDTGRLDPDYYNPVYLEDELKLKEFGCIELGKAGKFFAGPFGSKLPSNLYLDHGIPLFRVGNVGKMEVLTENFAHLDKFVHADLKASEVHPGDILIVKASVGEKICKVPDWIAKANITQHIIALRSNGRFDTDYVCSFLFSHYGVRQLTRRSLGSIIQYLGVNDSRTVLIPELREDAQKYIGNKVRQAETLRAWAKKLQCEIFDYFISLSSNPPAQKRSWRVKTKNLVSYRINPKHYDPVVTFLINRAKKQGVNLVKLGEMIGDRGISGGATPKGAEYPLKGVFFVRVQNVNMLQLDLSDAVYIDDLIDEELTRSRCKENDIILSITGYPGTASLVGADDLPVNINQHSVRFDVKDNIDPGYVCAAINSQFVKYQVNRLAIGGTREALDYKSVKDLLIPVLSADVQKSITLKVYSHNRSARFSRALIQAAKLLTEALIEQKLTEQDLINAQQALDKGDTSRDQNILSRLATTGIDNNDSPLFPDLDQLYQLLKQADNPEEEE